MDTKGGMQMSILKKNIDKLIDIHIEVNGITAEDLLEDFNGCDDDFDKQIKTYIKVLFKEDK